MNQGNGFVNITGEMSDSSQVLHVLTLDGMTLNFSRDYVSSNKSDQVMECIDLNNIIEKVLAYKCKGCSFLCESSDDIINHVQEKNCIEVTF